MNLDEYNRKRNFKNSPEPEGEHSLQTNLHRFVVQRHKARKLHYDLRLEIDGTLKSWAVPKGPSMNPNDKRLAVRTEDHPLDYLTFQGSIPKGNYGAGDMQIWDHGTFSIDRSEIDLSASGQLDKGNLKLIMNGKNLLGKFALVHTGDIKGKESWLLIKKRDDYATNFLYDSEFLIENKQDKDLSGENTIRPQRIIKPMLASVSKNIFNDPEWIFELKWDGYRVLAHISEKGVLLQSRNGIDLNRKFEILASELEQVTHEVILDGEVVVVDSNGVSRFGELQNYPEAEGQLQFYVFDMLYLNGHSMLDLPLVDRKSLIPKVLSGLQISRYCDHIEGMGTALFSKASDVGMEGVMAKNKNSTYTPGARTEQWLKVKSVEDIDALICGYTDPVESSNTFGSLILGIRNKGKLTYIGNCGSGFSEMQRSELWKQFQPFKIDSKPFESSPRLKGRKPNWMSPAIECEVKFSERTKNGLLRNPVFKRIIGSIVGMESIVDMEKSKPVEQTKFKSQSGDFIKVDGFSVPISNLEKIYWPKSGMTKYDLIDYYLAIGDIMVPHLKGRPQSLHRHPNGIEDEGFYQKDFENAPEWMQSIRIYSKSSSRDIEYLVCNTTASLLYLANLGCIEINPWNSSQGSLDAPDYGIIDLDPPEGMSFGTVCKIALEFKNVIDTLRIPGFCKTSGSKGLHIYVPTGGKYTYEEVRNFIKLLCHIVEQRLPDMATLERRIKNRDGKVYLDYLQNRKGHTIASVYSVRPLPTAPVSAPITWDEINDDLSPRTFTIKNLPERIAKVGNLFAPVLTNVLDMEKALNDVESML
ncbi:MAG TPA: DNA ligase D [Pricia antarctica]|uniref:DNA ligase (ATP) n=1 Tax=Pricia antarctica TaxID=641691 RepID=A0A831VRX8_9FLAO|nr:DNA ligase D [Pricia antarctica]